MYGVDTEVWQRSIGPPLGIGTLVTDGAALDALGLGASVGAAWNCPEWGSVAR